MRHSLTATVCALALGVGLVGTSAVAATPNMMQKTNTILSSAKIDTPVEFTILLPSKDAAGLKSFLSDVQNPASAQFHKWLSPQDYAAKFGPSAAAIATVRKEMAKYGIAVVGELGTGVRVSGTAGAVTAAFGAKLNHVRNSAGVVGLAANGRLKMSAPLAAVGAQVIHFDPTVRVHTHARLEPQNRISTTGSYYNTDLRQAYDAPDYRNIKGTGVNIAILISGDVNNSDTAAYFTHEGLPVPNVTRVAVDGGAPVNDSGSFEASLDVQQSAGIAPGANIIIYLIPDLSNQHIMDGLSRIVADNKADIVSMSFGGCEKVYSAAYNGGTDFTNLITALEPVFKQGNAQGITFVASSGDDGGLQCPSLGYLNGQSGTKFVAGASTPATSPEVTAVGGTNLVTTFTSGSKNSAYVSENANGDPRIPLDPFGVGVTMRGGYWGSGGGPSIVFARPTFQSVVTTGTTMRATPDVSLMMGGCPGDAVQPCGPNRSSVVEIFNGKAMGAIGTSASAPQFAGVLALAEEGGGTANRLGNVNTALYQIGAGQTAAVGTYRRNIAGNNGVYTSSSAGTAKYNMVIGLGTVDIRQLIGATGVPAAGIPGTPSNP